MATAARTVTDVCREAKRASRTLARLDTDARNGALEAIAAALEERTAEVLEANARDMEAGAAGGAGGGPPGPVEAGGGGGARGARGGGGPPRRPRAPRRGGAGGLPPPTPPPPP